MGSAQLRLQVGRPRPRGSNERIYYVFVKKRTKIGQKFNCVPGRPLGAPEDPRDGHHSRGGTRAGQSTHPNRGANVQVVSELGPREWSIAFGPPQASVEPVGRPTAGSIRSEANGPLTRT